MIELPPPDAIADHRAVVRLDRTSADAACPEARDRLQHIRLRVLFGIDLERLKNGRGDPASADFISWKNLLVQDRDIQSRTAQLPSAGRAYRSAADDQDIACVHVPSSASEFSVAYSRARVQEIGWHCAPVNTTWNNCRVPVRNAANDPAK